MSDRANTPEACPLTQEQLGVYLDCAENPDSLRYNIPVICLLPEKTDTARLIGAIQAVACKHPALFAKVSTINGIPCMVEGAYEVSVTQSDVVSIEQAAEDFCRPFDLEAGPLFRFEIAHAPEGDAFLLDAHHLVFDGTSLSVFLHQVASVYGGSECPGENLAFVDCARERNSSENADNVQAMHELLARRLDGADWMSKPISDRVVENNEGGVEEILLKFGDAQTIKRLEAFVSEQGVSENALFLGAFGYALAKFNGATESAFATAYHGRTDKRLATTVGMFVRMVPIVCRFDESMPPATLLHDMYNAFYELKQNDCVPFAEIATRYGATTEITFVFQSELFDDVPLGNGTMEVRMQARESVSDLEFMLMKRADGYELTLLYDTDEYTESLARSLMNMFVCVVDGMTRASTLGTIELADEQARNSIDAFNQTQKDYDANKTVVDLFRERAAAAPDAICLVFEAKRFTYREVDEITDKVARRLLRAGFGRGEVAGILIPRCEHMLLCSLGVLKAGGVYLPMDSGYPSERLNLMLRDSAASVLVTTPELETLVEEGLCDVRFMADELVYGPTDALAVDSIRTEPTNETPPAPTSDDLFIMLYTSGSTGTPKGVVFSHGNAMVTAMSMGSLYGMTADSRLAAYASFGFDANVLDTFVTLTAGAQLHIVPDDIRLDLLALKRCFEENGITHVLMTTQVGRQFALMGGSAGLQKLFVGGEKLVPLDPPENFELFNLYGPTEGSVVATGMRVDKKYRDVPIGKAVANIKLYVVDPLGRLLPPGGVGELWLAGPHVTQGYHNLPEKTAQAYVDNPFSDEPGYGRAYRTGDVVRQLDDGAFQFIGRRDAQVKIRGFRVELTEVEEVVRRFEGIEDAAVAAFQDEAGASFIVAYVVSKGKVDIEELKRFVRSEKPEYIVPAVVMQIERIPLTQNHKVDRRALPRPERHVENAVPPETDMQRKIFDIVADIVGHEEFGINTNLFEAGLTSIGMLQLNVRLGEAFDIPVRIADLRENDTVRKLEAFLAAAREGDNPQDASARAQADYPLTQAQQGVFVECSANPDSVLYNIPLLVRVDAQVDADRLAAAVEKAIDAHPYLKATLQANDAGDIRVLRNDDEPACVERVTCDGVPTGEELVRPFQLVGGPLYRATVYKTLQGTYLFLDLHHLVSDGVSESLLLNDISTAYADQPIEPEALTGFDVAAEEEAARSTDRHAHAKEHFDALFAGLEADCAPPDAPAADMQKAAMLAKTLGVSMRDVQSYCERNKTTPNAFFLSAFGYALSRFTQTDDVAFATVYNGRNDTRLARTVSMLVKTLPVLVRAGEDCAVADFIRTLQGQLLDSMANDLFSFAEAASAYGVNSDVLFVYQGDSFAFNELCGLPASFVDVVPQVAKAAIMVTVEAAGDALETKVDYRPDRYNEVFVETLMDAFDCAVAAFTEAGKISEAHLLSDSSDALLTRMNDTARAFDNVPVNVLFERHAAAHPEALAVVADGKHLTFGELNDQANRLARSLVQLGVKKDTVVGIMLERTTDLPIAEIGVLKSGGAFLGLPPAFPDDRVHFSLADAGSPVVITTEDILAAKPELFAADKPYRAVTVSSLTAHDDGSNLDLPIEPDSLSYCIYTSGSTGKPKGVMLEHHGLACFAQPADHLHARYFGVEGGKMSLSFSSISFDMSLLDNLVFLLNGSAVCIATESERHNPMALAQLIEDNGVDAVTATPSLFTTYLKTPAFKEALGHVRVICVAGEPFPAPLLVELREAAPQARVVNGYGPSECTIVCASKELADGEVVTIGPPVPNTAFYVVDKFGNVLPPYGCGELIICGEQVGRGYANLPEKTASAYIVFKGMPAFRSGDVARITADGEAECFGRIDNQVKLRGYRIELDEIENRICAFDGIMQSKVVVRNNGSEDYLAGFFTAKRPIDLDELVEHLKKSLTYYMVPDVLMQLDSMPLNPNGKIDKHALPETRREARKSGRKPPKKSLEQKICDLFTDVLSLDECFADDNFFELGGTSLSASKVVMQLMAEGLKVQYQDIFDNPTPEALAAHIEASGQQPASEVASAAVVDQPNQQAMQFEEHPVQLLDLLEHNTLAHAAEVKREPVGDVLLAGATGFLGIHVLRELLEADEGNIACIVRSKEDVSGEKRLKGLLMYYFDQPFEEEFGKRITVVESDITDADLSEKLADIHFETLINCAADVKHYSADNAIEHSNVTGVDNLIACARNADARMIQVSTISIPGFHTEETRDRQIRMSESELFIVESLDNKYLLSKYHAELKVLEAVREGLRGKIVRVGNLMGRHSDGEFQINSSTNAFLSAIRGFSVIGKCPLSHATDPVGFSPVDLTARVIVLLAGTNDEFTAFNANSRYIFDEMQLIDACNRCGVKIEPVPDQEYYDDYHRMLADDAMNASLSGLVTNDRPDLHVVDVDNTFTANVLYRLGFAWPLVDPAYLDRAVDSLVTLDYFSQDQHT